MSLPAVFLGLGANLGDRAAALDRALGLLGAKGFRVRRMSSLYETEPVGGPPQGPFLNAVVEGETLLPPSELLGACLGVEREMGRVRAERNGPRVIDVDILLYGDVVLESDELVLPHPRFHERRFVLVPLAELAPRLRHPVLRASVLELLATCADGSLVVTADAQPGRS